MRQAVMTAPGTIELRTVADVTAGPGQVLMRIQRIGVCGSDVHVNHGKHPFVDYPVVQGHEYFAIVQSVGDGVTGIRPGMKITATPQVVCGKCRPCRRGRYNVCENLIVRGFKAPGVAQDLQVIEPDKIVNRRRCDAAFLRHGDGFGQAHMRDLHQVVDGAIHGERAGGHLGESGDGDGLAGGMGDGQSGQEPERPDQPVLSAEHELADPREPCKPPPLSECMVAQRRLAARMPGRIATTREEDSPIGRPFGCDRRRLPRHRASGIGNPNVLSGVFVGRMGGGALAGQG